MCDLVTDNTSEATNLPQHAIFIRGVDHAYNFTETSVSSNIKRHKKSRDFYRAEKMLKQFFHSLSMCLVQFLGCLYNIE